MFRLVPSSVALVRSVSNNIRNQLYKDWCKIGGLAGVFLFDSRGVLLVD